MDAINVKIRDGQVANRPVYVVMAVTVDGTRDILGIWAGDGPQLSFVTATLAGPRKSSDPFGSAA